MQKDRARDTEIERQGEEGGEHCKAVVDITTMNNRKESREKEQFAVGTGENMKEDERRRKLKSHYKVSRDSPKKND